MVGDSNTPISDVSTFSPALVTIVQWCSAIGITDLKISKAWAYIRNVKQKKNNSLIYEQAIV